MAVKALFSVAKVKNMFQSKRQLYVKQYLIPTILISPMIFSYLFTGMRFFLLFCTAKKPYRLKTNGLLN